MNSPIRKLFIASLLISGFVATSAFGQVDLQPDIAGLPRSTKTKSGHSSDLINLGLVGTKAEIITAMQASGWFAADPVTLKTSFKMTGSVVFRKTYKFAPVSALFFQGRKQDLAFEKPDGKSASRRHHVRFWKVIDQGAEGREVWLGAGTFDKSVGFSHVNGKITHHISADVDAEREIIITDLIKSMRLQEVYMEPGTGLIKDARNGGGDHYFSDGKIHFAVIAIGANVQTNPPQDMSAVK